MKREKRNWRWRSIIEIIFAIIGVLSVLAAVALGGLLAIDAKEIKVDEIINDFEYPARYISYCNTTPEKKMSCMRADPSCSSYTTIFDSYEKYDECHLKRHQFENYKPIPYTQLLSEQKEYIKKWLDKAHAQWFNWPESSWKKVSINIVPASRFSANDNLAEVFIIENLPLDACVELATYDWPKIGSLKDRTPIYPKHNFVIMAVGVGNMAAETLACGDGCIERSGDGCTGEAGTEPLIGCPNGSVKSLPLSKQDALAACKKSGQIAVKFR